MNYYPDISVYTFEHWPRRKGPFKLRVLQKGQVLRFSIEHGTEGVIKLTGNEGNQLMKALMHHFNLEVK